MKNHPHIIIWFIFVSLFLLNCGASHRLGEYEFRDRTAAAVMASPPRAQIFTDSFFAFGGDNPLETAIRIGTTIAKDVEAQKAQKRLDAALQQVDIPELIRAQTLKRSASYMHLQPLDDETEADYLFMMDIRHYGISAESWNANVYFKIKVKIRVLDTQRNLKIWEKDIKENEPVSGSYFGLGGAVGDVITAVRLSQLSEEEMAHGFTQLAEFLSDRIAAKIHSDYLDAHSD